MHFQMVVKNIGPGFTSDWKKLREITSLIKQLVLLKDVDVTVLYEMATIYVADPNGEAIFPEQMTQVVIKPVDGSVLRQQVNPRYPAICQAIASKTSEFLWNSDNHTSIQFPAHISISIGFGLPLKFEDDQPVDTL